MNTSGVSYDYYKKPLKSQVALIEIDIQQNKKDDPLFHPQADHNCSRIMPTSEHSLKCMCKVMHIQFQQKVARIMVILKSQQESQKTEVSHQGHYLQTIYKKVFMLKRGLIHSRQCQCEELVQITRRKTLVNIKEGFSRSKAHAEMPEMF